MQHPARQLVIEGLTRALTSPDGQRLLTEKPCRYAWPQIPHIGRSYETSPLKIVIVGKATFGWGEEGRASSLSEFAWPSETLWNRTAQATEDFVSRVYAHYAGERGYYSSFWNRTFGMCTSLLEHRNYPDFTRSPERSRIVFDSIVWTNLFKIGRLKGNPDSDMIKLLLGRGPQLRNELELLWPDIVIFSTGLPYDGHLLDAGLSVTPEGSRLARVDVPARLVAIRSPHFQAQTCSDVDELYRRLRSVI